MKIKKFNDHIESKDIKTSEIFEKFGFKICIEYTGGKDPNKDRFLMHFTGYDDMIGNEIEGEHDFKDYKDPDLKKYAKKIWKSSPITSGVSYFNVYDVFNFYKKCLNDTNSIKNFQHYVEEYNQRINSFGFKITYVEIQ